MTQPERYIRGAFAVFQPTGDGTQSNLIPFRFNPEQLSRSLQIEQAQQQQNTEGAQTRSGGAHSEQASDALDGPLKYTFSVMIRFDLRDRESARADVTTENEVLQLGVLPELAALEELMYPADGPRTNDSQRATAQRPPRPVVLLVWGLHRVFPVRVVSMTINETLHNAELAPIRAEVEVGLEMARDESTGHRATIDALGFMRNQRRDHARRFYRTVGVQGTNASRLGEYADERLRDK
ncbi:MAG: hypothetical protein ACKV2T_00740 [Kofleriaceae bacterium]